jgi:hypothetical protein
VNPRPDTRVHDRVVLDEIELYGELIIAASGSDGPLSQDEIDAILGVRHEDSSALAEATSNPGLAATIRSTRGAVPVRLRRSAS